VLALPVQWGTDAVGEQADRADGGGVDGWQRIAPQARRFAAS
jgi:hypothetical protein